MCHTFFEVSRVWRFMNDGVCDSDDMKSVIKRLQDMCVKFNIDLSHLVKNFEGQKKKQALESKSGYAS